jgi:hypothetical protein
VTHDGRDPQVDLVRRYARILRSAPAEAVRAQRHDTPRAVKSRNMALVADRGSARQVRTGARAG